MNRKFHLMVRYLLSLVLVTAFLTGYSQLVIDGGTVTVDAGASMIVEGDMTFSNSGDIEINGTLQLKGDIVNNSGTINSASAGTLQFTGSGTQEIKGTASTTFYGTVDINNGDTVKLTSAGQTISGSLTFTSGMLQLNDHDLTLATGSSISGYGNSAFIQTNGTGHLVQNVAGSDVIFPLGNSAYNPMTLNNTGGTADDYSVRVKDVLPANYTVTDHAVERTWEVGESTSGGSNLAVTAQWNGTEQLPSFITTDNALGVTTDSGTSFTWSDGGPASGTDPYTQTASGIASVGEFVVADYFVGEGIDLDLDVLLAGPYAGSGLMNKTLNTSGLIPLSDPYGAGTTASSIPVDAVDWVKLELRDKNSNTSILHTYAKFVDINGNLLNEDGTPLNFKGLLKDQYYVGIHHRNHFGVVSASPVDMTAASPVIDFTASQATAYQDGSITSNAAMTQVGTSPDVYALWQGDANGDGFIAYFGGTSDRSSIISEVGSSSLGNVIHAYSGNDLNLDGYVAYFGGTSDRSVLIGVVGASTLGTVLTAHLP